MNEEQLRIYALETAMRIEGVKAITEEVLDAARRIYEFLTDAEASTGVMN